MARHNTIGTIGEDVASKWFTDAGYLLIERNYRKPYGEIDIIAEHLDIIHFIEVKSVSYETISQLKEQFSRETYRPEENVHFDKQIRLSRVIEVWLSGHQYTGLWQIDIMAVYLVPHEKYAQVELLSNVIFG